LSEGEDGQVHRALARSLQRGIARHGRGVEGAQGRQGLIQTRTRRKNTTPFWQLAIAEAVFFI